jgi:sugar lactone lactonase YvrE
MNPTSALLVLGSGLLAFSQEAQDVEQAAAPRVVVETFSRELEGGSGGMEVDATGFVYCSDFGSKLGAGSTGGDRVWRLDPETGKDEVFVTGQRGASGNAIGPDGAFYQSNIGASTITRTLPDGTSSVFLRENLRNPVGIAIDEEGMLFVANCGSASILEVTPEGESNVFVTNPLLSCPNGITLDEEHNLYVANFNNGDVIKVDWAGEVTRLATLPGKNNGHLVYREGFLYVVARGAHQIYRVSLEGEVELFAGTGERGRDDGPALEATFSFPNDLAFSPDGKTLYVNENGSTTAPHTELAPVIVRAIRIRD